MEIITTEYSKLDMSAEIRLNVTDGAMSSMMTPVATEVDIYIPQHGNEPAEITTITIKDPERKTVTEIPKAIYVGRSGDNYVRMRGKPGDRDTEMLININAHWKAIAGDMIIKVVTERDDND